MVYNVNTKSRKAQRKAWNCRAWLNGVEVTKRCFYADPRRGVVKLFLVNEEGRFYQTPSGDAVATEERHGRVVVRRQVATR